MQLQEREVLFNAVPREEMPENMRAAYDRAAEIGDTTEFEVFANAPVVVKWYTDSYDRLFYSGEVDTRLKELARLRMSRSNGCALCSAWNAGDLLEVGFSEAQVDSIWPWPEEIDTSLFSAQELAVLRLADQMVLANMEGALDRELYTELRQHFSDSQIIELGAMMMFLTGMTKFALMADLVPKLDTCQIPGATGVGDLKIVPAARLNTRMGASQ